ncbi:MAG: ADP-forming succinate--CoA ligase subunit beta [Planctomycetes bacterium]|nr:ADP-forming succinate--CoA ligase subunit beta [Planctomycetota bacterium]
MNLHEHQAKQILSRYGVPLLTGRLAETPDEAARAYRELGVPVVVVKAQIHAGGRGKGGGVRLVRSADEARDFAAKLLGKPLVTPQTGPQGRVVRKLWIEAGCDVERELYLGCVLDRKLGQPVLMASKEGGVEIEEVAARDPSAILKQPFDVAYGLRPFQARALGWGLGLQGEAFTSFLSLAAAVARMFVDRDCSLLEINPLVVTRQGALVALDAKMAIDDRALELKKQPELEAMRDVHEEDPLEREAAQHGLNYVSMDGNIGCMVNGAGLAMSTMDLIQLAGGRPANFLDVGGGANKDQVSKAFKLLVANPSVRAVLINIFGGILRCDVLAQGIVDAVKEVHVKVPIVVRLEGTNVGAGRDILRASGLKIIAAADMSDAAKKVIEAAGIKSEVLSPKS